METRLNDLEDILTDALHIVKQLRTECLDHNNTAIQEGEYIDPAYCAQYREECKTNTCPDCLLSVPFNVTE